MIEYESLPRTLATAVSHRDRGARRHAVLIVVAVTVWTNVDLLSYKSL